MKRPTWVHIVIGSGAILIGLLVVDFLLRAGGEKLSSAFFALLAAGLWILVAEIIARAKYGSNKASTD